MWGSDRAYERFMGRWSRALTDELVRDTLAAGASTQRWLDVGCGTGSGIAAALAGGVDAVVGLEPSPTFATAASERFRDAPVEIVVGDATTPLDGDVDVVISSLVLNFTPDPVAALRAMGAALRPGGHGVVAVWDYADPRSFLSRFWGAVAAVQGRPATSDERTAFPVSTRDGLSAAATAAGWQPTVRTVEVSTPFVDAEDLWEPFLHGIGPAGQWVQDADADTRERVRAMLVADVFADGAPASPVFPALVVRTNA